MPIYEFFCPKNQRIYSFFARSLAYSDKTPRCPDNPKWKLEKMVSSFAVTGRAKEKPETPAGGEGPDLDDPRMEKMMAEMEREFSSIGDDDNPDPKVLGRMMRKMMDFGGDKVPAAMEEMVARLEKGEDPEKLEEEYGDALEGMDEMFGDSPEAKEAVATLRKKRKRITRDPTLYEMADYCE